MDLSSFLEQARKLVDAEKLFPHASGFQDVPVGVLPSYTTNEAWEADFGEACRPPRDDDTLTQPYAIHARASVAEFLAANPHVKLHEA